MRQRTGRRITTWILGLTIALAAVAVGVAQHRLGSTNASAADVSGLRAVPAVRYGEPGSALTATSPTTSTTVAPEPTTVAVPPTTIKRRTSDVSPITGTINAKVSAFGDSVMRETGPTLEAVVSELTVDAVNGRPTDDTIEAVQSAYEAGNLGDEVIVQVGNNGPVSRSQFDRLMSLLTGPSRVVVVNIKADREWEAQSNEVIAAGVERWPNTVLADWNEVASADPDSLLSDGVHLQPAGVQAYSRLVLSAL